MKNFGSVLFVLWPIVTFAQNQPIEFSHKLQESVRGLVFNDTGQKYSLRSYELIRSIFIADFKGIAQKGIWLRITETLHYTDRLVFYDPKTQRELCTLPLNYGEENNVYQADFDGNGISELIVVRPQLRGPATLEDPAFHIYSINEGKCSHNKYAKFYGFWGMVGNITGDKKDEVLLFKHPSPFDNDDGPVDILALSWNGNEFEQIASVSLPRMSLGVELVDLDNDDREEIVLLQVIWHDDHKIGPAKLAIYSYTGNPDLTLVDEIELAVDLGEEIGMGRFWTQPLVGGGYRIIVPIPEPWYFNQKHRKGILEYRNFRLIANRLIREPNILNFKWKYYDDTPRSLSSLSPTPQIVNGYLQIHDSKRLELIKKLPPALPKR